MIDLIESIESWENDVALLTSRLREITHCYFGTSNDRVDGAINLAIDLHDGHFRDEGVPYVVHPLRVSLALAKKLDSYPHPRDPAPIAPHTLICVAILHDVFEDCAQSYDIVEKGLGSEVCRLVSLLSRRIGPNCPKLNRRAYFQRLMSAPEGIRAVKILDNLDNLRGLLFSRKPRARRLEYLQSTADYVLPLSHAALSKLLKESARDLAEIFRRLQLNGQL